MALHQVNPAHYVISHLPPILYTELRVGSGRVIPTEFTPPSPDDTPQSLFPHCPKVTAIDRVHRFIRLNEENRSVEDEFLIYTDATCLDNGKTNARAGCSFVYNDSASGWARFPLEFKGPSGEQYILTVHRAHIRAVIAALRYKDWAADGFSRLVIATDSDYLVEGITDLIREWLHSDWVSTSGEPIKNRDLWERLLGEVEILEEKGISVQFWRIPKELNVKADRHAKHAAFMERHQQFTDLAGTSNDSV
ncbi:Polynucleotidyl transferase, ribonuclease H fold [Penicillium camemberti]|uniref:ribonuclease H n=1 Tax=Penicillium camemberti (strain FM 013) TaxID=1429867 RepID=A0A0G4P033_PENC3|nr:Polynucleotidyl transferase, ribonuclease H fold [Penicillium camemberti]